MVTAIGAMYRLKLYIRFVLSDKIARQKRGLCRAHSACGGALGFARRLEQFTLEIAPLNGKASSPCDNLAARICRQTLAERFIDFQCQSALVS
ncbi:MAG: hypothetical protein LBU06_03655 [Desulfovibrio sp.]|jgi:hypothetical protein|nr:hypothetical protein [Desulfovibrio sp.]